MDVQDVQDIWIDSLSRLYRWSIFQVTKIFKDELE